MIHNSLRTLRLVKNIKKCPESVSRWSDLLEPCFSTMFSITFFKLERDERCIQGLSRKFPAIYSMKNRNIYQRKYNNAIVFKVDTLGPYTVLPSSLPPLKTLRKILCWNLHQLPLRIFLNLIYGLKFLPFPR